MYRLKQIGKYDNISKYVHGQHRYFMDCRWHAMSSCKKLNLTESECTNL